MTDEDFKPNLEADCQHEMRFMSHRENGKWVCCLCLAVEAEREACASLVEKAGGFDHGDYTAVGNVVGFILSDIRARSTPKSESTTA